jgi:hypothetical protein
MCTVPGIYPESQMEEADELLARLRQGQDGDGQDENELLRAFLTGYPILKLRELLEAKDDRGVVAGAWIAAELGAVARPLFPELTGLLQHPHFRARFFVLDYLASCAGPDDHSAISKALGLLTDPHPTVVWKALLLLKGLPIALLGNVMREAIKKEPFGSCASGLRLLIESSTIDVGPRITTLLAGGDELLRRYAVSAAARIADRNQEPLRQAMLSQDVVVRQFAVDMAEFSGLSDSHESDEEPR